MTKSLELRILCEYESVILVLEPQFYSLAMTLVSKRLQSILVGGYNVHDFILCSLLRLFSVGSLALKYSFLQGETKWPWLFHNVIGGHRPYVTPMDTWLSLGSHACQLYDICIWMWICICICIWGKRGRATVISPPDSAGFRPGRGIWESRIRRLYMWYIYNMLGHCWGGGWESRCTRRLWM